MGLRFLLLYSISETACLAGFAFKNSSSQSVLSNEVVRGGGKMEANRIRFNGRNQNS
jgi:hypothetical protein